MKVFTPEISWHQKEPVFSVDFCYSTWRLATGGADFTVKIWQIKEDEEEGNIGIDFLANLDRHSKPVNVVRFSPDGQFLASAGDDCIIIIWKLSDNDENRPQGSLNSDDIQNKESWTVQKMFRRGHLEDIYDLSWSPDGKQIISGSVDNSAIIWNAETGCSTNILKDHKHYVQGVCWDPRGQYYVTYSSDRSCKIYSATTHKCLHNIHKASLPMREPVEEGPKSKMCKLFLDETMQSFFRRCSFSPDGSLLVLPGGVNEAGEKNIKTTYVFTRAQLNKPALCLPGPNKPSVASCFCPVVHELKDYSNDINSDKPKQPFFKTPYRMSFAVATLDSILLYDTQHPFPFGMVASVHYAPLTDLAWSSDGRILVVSSLDGYCSFIRFEKDELGEPIKYDAIEYLTNQMKAKQESKKEQAEAAKTPVVPSQDKDKQPSSRTPTPAKDQPTLHKFITPGGKRKRHPTKLSPTNQQFTLTPKQIRSPGNSKGYSPTGSPPESRVKLTLSGRKLEPINESLLEESTAKIDDKQTQMLQPINTKPPKRAKLLTLTPLKPLIEEPLINNNSDQLTSSSSQLASTCSQPTHPTHPTNQSTNQPTISTSSSAKEPRRITLQTSSLKTDKSAPQLVSSSSSQSTQPTNQPPHQPPHQPTSSAKVPRRIALQTLSTITGARSAPKPSPNIVEESCVSQKEGKPLACNDSSDSDPVNKVKYDIINID